MGSVIMSEPLKTILEDFFEYAVEQEIEEAQKSNKPISREEAEQRVNDFFEKA
jgi:hypothetical protein